MSVIFYGVAALWQDLAKAIEEKCHKPWQFERVYIGRIEPPAHSPVHRRRAAGREDLGYRGEAFWLSEPFIGVALTRRETQLLFLICQGYTNQSASERMHLSVRTTEYYIKNLRRKILAKSKAHLVKQILLTDFMQRVDASVLAEEDAREPSELAIAV